MYVALQPSEGEWCLEDLTGCVRLDLSAYIAKDMTSSTSNSNSNGGGGGTKAIAAETTMKSHGSVPGECYVEKLDIAPSALSSHWCMAVCLYLLLHTQTLYVC
jgi:hypothetical protein